jgi:hypothetical protein
MLKPTQQVVAQRLLSFIQTRLIFLGRLWIGALELTGVVGQFPPSGQRISEASHLTHDFTAQVEELAQWSCKKRRGEPADSSAHEAAYKRQDSPAHSLPWYPIGTQPIRLGTIHQLSH